MAIIYPKREMIYSFIDDQGTFTVNNPQRYNLYFPLTNRNGTLLSAITPRLSGDIKRDNEHFLTPPASIEDLAHNLLCRREFYIKTDTELLRLSEPYHDRLEAGFLYHKLTKETKSLSIEILTFIPCGLDAEVMRIKIANKTNRPVQFTPTSFIPLYGRSERNVRDHRHVSSLLNRVALHPFGIVLTPTMVFDETGHKENQVSYFGFGFEGNGRVPAGQFPTLEYFCGSKDLSSPEGIEGKVPAVRKKLPVFDGKEACAALRFQDKKLRGQESVEYFLVHGIADSPKEAQRIFRKLNSPQKIAAHFKATRSYWQEYLSSLQFDFKDRDFNNWLCWVRLQPTLRKLFGCSFLPHFDYGKGGRGWRDLWQDALTLLLTEQEKTGAVIFNNFKGVRIDGTNATIITKEGDFISDRNRISRVWMDHAIWPFLALRSYIHKSGDLKFLLKETTYFRDQQLHRAKEIDPVFFKKDFFLRTKAGALYKGSILEHLLVQNLVPFFNVGSHNIIRLENGDWNDGLDMAPQKGESVAFSFMYAHNLKGIAAMLRHLRPTFSSLYLLKEVRLLLDRISEPVNYSDHKSKQKRLLSYLKATRHISGKKIKIDIDELISDLDAKAAHLFNWLNQKEWLSLGFFNGYYDNLGRRVEGRKNGSMRMMLQSQVFPILSKGVGETRIKMIWKSLTRYLRDKKLGGFRLNTDFGSPYLTFGRAFGFSYGDKENGAFFNHMCVMLANGLYQNNRIKEGREVMASIYDMACGREGAIYPLIPEYFNRQGQGLYLYLTGSASWYVCTLMEEVLGIKSLLGDILLEPKLTAGDFCRGSIECKFRYYGKKIKVVFKQDKSSSVIYSVRRVTLNGNQIPFSTQGYIIKKKALSSRANVVNVLLG